MKIRIVKNIIFISAGIIGVLLKITSLILKICLSPIIFLYAMIKIISIKDKKLKDEHFAKYFKDLAIVDDVYGNVLGRYLFNDILIKKDGYKFGRKYETISSVIGKNKKINKLTIIGKIICFILDLIEKNHTEKAINNKEECLEDIQSIFYEKNNINN